MRIKSLVRKADLEFISSNENYKIYSGLSEAESLLKTKSPFAVTTLDLVEI